MKRIEVVAAIIRREDRVFATRRGYGEWKGWWEWPGGKMEAGETPRQALVREIREELDTEIRIDKFLHTVEWDYPTFHLTMHCYICSLLSGTLRLNEHEAARWLTADTLRSVRWLPADIALLPLVEQELAGGSLSHKQPEPQTMSMETQLKIYEGRPTEGDEGRTVAETAVYDFLDGTGVAYTTLCHPAAFTMEECEAVRKAIGAPVFKNLFLTNKQQTLYFLLMIPADKPYKTKYLSSQLGCARLSFASSEAMSELLHIAPGAVSPLGLIHDKDLRVQLIVDRDLTATGRYACHPCVNTASVALSLTDLLEKVVPATGHAFRWVDLPAETEQP